MIDLNEDLGTTLWVVNSVFAVLATATVLGRFAARSVLRMDFGADDWIICIALALNWAMYALAARAEMNGMGRHIETLTPTQIIFFTKNLYYMQITYVPAPPAVKLSLLCLYRRIFQYTRFLWFVYGMMAVVIIWCTINLFLVIFFCTPISALWTGKGKCLDLDPYSYAVINVLTTLIVWAMPIPRVWKLQLPRGQKVALSLIFALGLFDCSTAIGRVILMPDKDEEDKTWYYAKPCMMHIIEVSTGIVCTCLPTMRVSIKEAFSGNCFCFISCFGWVKTRKLDSSASNNTYEMERDLGPGSESRRRGPGKFLAARGKKTTEGDISTKMDPNLNTDTSAGLCCRPDGCHTEISRCSGVGDTHFEERGSREILVTEEIDVELRAIERVAERNRGEASNG